ncbi:hypothetical protein CRG98_039010 [Punica granatum]|uniref:Uncharacterized protein n=1 Tax=Punica granatum TaxID=22663 RepID=A0A2I0IA96_PUNGR|nr:hypothetical protein CRG98_039010 [Punica granatum]
MNSQFKDLGNSTVSTLAAAQIESVPGHYNQKMPENEAEEDVRCVPPRVQWILCRGLELDEKTAADLDRLAGRAEKEEMEVEEEMQAMFDRETVFPGKEKTNEFRVFEQ